jgi:hypothetical protein
VKTYDNPGVGKSCGNCTNEIASYDGGWSTYTIPNNGAIFVEGNVWVEGMIDTKRLTIVATSFTGTVTNVYIKNNITYAHSNGTETLGIIAENDIEIIKNSANLLTINAALLAQKGRVGRTSYGSSDHKSTITVYGAIATNKRYGFSWTNGVNSWGYTTRNLYYDNNLLYFPPPYFPTGSQYLMDLWEEI